MGSWSDLQTDMLRLIARRLTVAVDRVRFSSVCKNWLQLAISEPKYLPCPPPWLMLAEISGTTIRQLAGLTAAGEAKDRIFELDFPGGQGTRCVGSVGLWVVTVNVKGEMRILNPFTGEKPIELPPLSSFEEYDDYVQNCTFYVEGCEITNVPLTAGFVPHKVAISSSLDDAELISMAIYDDTRKLAFYRHGGSSNSWTTIDHKRLCFTDVLFYCGKFYAVNARGIVFVCDLDGLKMMPISNKLRVSFNNSDARRRYLIEWSDMLLQVLRIIVPNYETDEYPTVGFEIYRLEFHTSEWIRLNDLGGHSLFVGLNTAVAVLASDVFNLEPNCIYFTDDYRITLDDVENGRDMGVFSLADGAIKPHYRGVSLSVIFPPIWIVPNSLSHQGLWAN